MHRIRIKRPLAVASTVLVVAGGALAVAATSASAASNLSVTLSAHGDATVQWDALGNPVLHVGGAGSSAMMQINSPPFTPPTDPPAFDSTGFSGNAPHWLIQFAGGDALLGLAGNSGHDATNWTVVTPASGTCHLASPPALNTYATQLKLIEDAGCAGTVSSAAIVADSPNVTATLTGIQYAGLTLVPGADVVTVTNPGAQTSTLGTAITALQIVASSSKGDAIASYAASGLPAGLSIDATKGTISGTPTATGTFAVTVSATDNGGTKGSVMFNWTVNTSTPPPHVTYTGTIRLFRMGLCLDDANNNSNSGAVVQVWRCNGLQNQVWQVMSDGTIQHNGLCLDARGFGTADRTPIQLWKCTGGPNQQWDTRGFRVHYDNPNAFHKVLDDPAFGGNGTRQILFTENGGANQQWATF